METTYLACTGACETIRVVVLSLVLFASLTGGFAYTTWLERRFIAIIQARVGPNRAGPAGLLQPIADGIKLVFKEDITPSQADKVVFWLAPVITVMPALPVLGVVPLAPSIPIWIAGNWYVIPFALVDVNVGVLYVLAITSIAVYGVTLAGWASANKYSMLGGIRASAQMVSYELSLGLGVAVPIMIAGTMSFGKIVDAQFDLGWFILHNPLAAFILLVALLAEVNRAPFDLPEAEQELTAGYHTEYSGMKFALFFMAEYIKMAVVSVVAFSLFFGGFGGPLVDSDYATGQVALTNTTGATVLVQRGTLVHNATDDPERRVIFETMQDVSIPAGATAIVGVDATTRTPGLLGNVPAGTLTMVEGVSGVSATNPEPTAGGGQEFVFGPLLGIGYLLGKVVAALLTMVWIRATFPRFRYDQLMSFGWKVMLPLALLAAAWTATALVLSDEAGGNPDVYWVIQFLLTGAIVGIIFIAFVASVVRRRRQLAT
ncbi:MAG: NADH-quinone oxidoreductase subunit H [Anaerolineae bacterium]|nr:NADH-quinone oxidoreductase subunit H [Anaerolineae bacterium]